jgi:glucokinase
MIVLSGDIGGTKTILRLCNIDKDSADIILEQTFPSRDYPDFYTLLDLFLSSPDIPSINSVNACFAVAGPVVNGTSKITNLPWTIDEKTLNERFHFSFLKLVNDFTAIGFGISQLTSHDLIVLHPGLQRNTQDTKTVLGAGTGLGMCMVIPTDNKPLVLPSEFGNTNFASSDEFSIELSLHLLKHKKTVMHEDVLSGDGLVSIYNFLKKKFNSNESTLENLSDNSDSAAYISQSALSGKDHIAEQALDYFVKIYAAAASNVALTTLSTGGLYIAGGIAPKIISKLKTTMFSETFLNNKKMHHILKNIPVYAIVNTNPGLLGATEIAKFAQPQI